MKFSPVYIVNVYYKPKDKKIRVGKLALNSRKIFFEYDAEFLSLGLSLSPFKLPLKSGIIQSLDFSFEGLFGVFNDSLPDGWGRLLLDRSLIKHKINPKSLSLLDRLCFVGSQGMGALIYEPEIKVESVLKEFNLDKIADEISEFQENEMDEFVEDLLALGGSSGGARPKILINKDGEHWMVKFRSSDDLSDIGVIEYAYHLMALSAGLDVPKAKVFPSRKTPGFFAVSRFDKYGLERVHMHTVSGLLHADHRMPSLDYEMIMKATMQLTGSAKESIKIYRQCVFNVLSHNRDDHAKNFSFLMDDKGVWRVSPSYDLVFSSGPAGEHCSMVMGEGKNPGISHLLELAKVGGIKKSEALEIVDQVKLAVSQWSSFSKDAGVSIVNSKMIELAINKILRENF